MNNFLSKIVTGNETWCFRYEPESKMTKFAMETIYIPKTQESSHTEITNEEQCSSLSLISRLFHFEFIPQGQTVNQAYYVEILKRLCESLPRQSRQLWSNHDNARAHMALSVKQF
jgi:hypothetical protein